MRTATSWLSGVIAIALVLSGSSGAVWCFGPHHSDLEWLGEGCCDDASEATHGTTGVYAAGDGCGPCVDVALAATSSVPPIGPVVLRAAEVPAAVEVSAPGNAGCRALPRLTVPPLDGTRLRL